MITEADCIALALSTRWTLAELRIAARCLNAHNPAGHTLAAWIVSCQACALAPSGWAYLDAYEHGALTHADWDRIHAARHTPLVRA